MFKLGNSNGSNFHLYLPISSLQPRVLHFLWAAPKALDTISVPQLIALLVFPGYVIFSTHYFQKFMRDFFFTA